MLPKPLYCVNFPLTFQEAKEQQPRYNDKTHPAVYEDITALGE
jgi:hypothetical protein